MRGRKTFPTFDPRTLESYVRLETGRVARTADARGGVLGAVSFVRKLGCPENVAMGWAQDELERIASAEHPVLRTARQILVEHA